MLLAANIYRRLSERKDLGQAWNNVKDQLSAHSLLLLSVVGLMLLNWGIESIKWKILIAPVQKVSLVRAFKAILSGLSFSMFIPNGAGDYLGKMLYMDEGKKLRSIANSLIGSIAQILITCIAGLAGIFYLFTQVHNVALQPQGLSKFWLQALLYALVAGTIILIVLYFNTSLLTRWLEKIPFIHRHKIFIQSLKSFNWQILTKILLLSLSRYIVFIVQYVLVFRLLHVDIGMTDMIWAVCVLFLIMAIIPTIPFADIGIRGEAGFQVFGLFTSDYVGILSAVALIWLINLIIPAIIGSIFTWSIKIFKEKK